MPHGEADSSLATDVASTTLRTLVSGMRAPVQRDAQVQRYP